MKDEMIRYNMMGYILQNFPSYLSTPRGRDFNGMDCTDMVRYRFSISFKYGQF